MFHIPAFELAWMGQQISVLGLVDTQSETSDRFTVWQGAVKHGTTAAYTAVAILPS